MLVSNCNVFPLLHFRSLRNLLRPTNWNRFSLSSNPGMSAINQITSEECTNSEHRDSSREAVEQQQDIPSDSNPVNTMALSNSNATIQTIDGNIDRG